MQVKHWTHHKKWLKRQRLISLLNWMRLVAIWSKWRIGCKTYNKKLRYILHNIEYSRVKDKRVTLPVEEIRIEQTSLDGRAGTFRDIGPQENRWGEKGDPKDRRTSWENKRGANLLAANDTIHSTQSAIVGSAAGSAAGTRMIYPIF